ncbi:hypothetical protein HDN1F_04570 [gamma proteobacterium HdN1]|nr:hypothetical protein HDN1F_04570 [gamma proteobacterium HdN1]
MKKALTTVLSILAFSTYANPLVASEPEAYNPLAALGNASSTIDASESSASEVLASVLGAADTAKNSTALPTSAEEQVKLAMEYWHAEGDENLRKARELFALAAKQGNSTAQANLGSLLEHGEGGPADPVEAIYWYKQAALQGDKNAQYALGHAYRKGIGVQVNLEQALVWYRKSCDSGFALACSMVSIYGAQ